MTRRVGTRREVLGWGVSLSGKSVRRFYRLGWLLRYRDYGIGRLAFAGSTRGGFTAEELDFIINYDSKYPFGRNGGDEEE